VASFYAKREYAPQFDPRYNGRVKEYGEGACPNAESFRKRLCLFKTGMQTMEKIEREVDALRATIRSFS